jgi:hypothetical protein
MELELPSTLQWHPLRGTGPASLRPDEDLICRDMSESVRARPRFVALHMGEPDATRRGPHASVHMESLLICC